MKTKSISSLVVLFVSGILNLPAQFPPGIVDHGRPDELHQASFSLKNAMIMDDDDNIWIGTQTIGPYPGVLVKYSEGLWEVFTSENSGLPADTVYSLFPTKESFTSEPPGAWLFTTAIGKSLPLITDWQAIT